MSYSKTTYLALVVDISDLITDRWDEKLLPYYEGQGTVKPFEILESGFDGNGRTYFGIVLERDDQRDMIDTSIDISKFQEQCVIIFDRMYELFGKSENYTIQLRMFSHSA